MPLARRAVKSPICSTCRHDCCIDNLELSATDMKRIPKKYINENKIVKETWWGHLGDGVRYKHSGHMRSGDKCLAWSKRGCTLGDKKPLVCRRHYCSKIIEWAKSGKISPEYRKSAIEVLRSEARRNRRHLKKGILEKLRAVNQKIAECTNRIAELTA